MTEATAGHADRIRWSWRIAVVGLGITAVTILGATGGLAIPTPLYWLGVVFSIGGVMGVVAYETRYLSAKYGVAVISGMIGVLLTGYGVENANILLMVVGVFIVTTGATGVVIDTRREKSA